MRTAPMNRRTWADRAHLAHRALERTMRRVAGMLGIARALLQAEAIALHQRFVETGIVSETASIALAASELSTSEEITHEIAVVLTTCSLA